VRAVFRDLVEEKFPGVPFADQAAEQVRARDDDGVDGAAVDFGFKFGEGLGGNA